MSKKKDKEYYALRSGAILLLVHLWIMMLGGVSVILLAAYAPSNVSIIYGLCVGLPCIVGGVFGLYYTKKEKSAAKETNRVTKDEKQPYDQPSRFDDDMWPETNGDLVKGGK